MPLVPLQLSVALTPATHPDSRQASVDARADLVGAGQTHRRGRRVGHREVVVQVALLVAASVAVTVIVCTPIPPA